MKLEELLKKITPLPWGDEIHGTRLPRNSNGSETEGIGNRAYIYHAANQLPKLVEALEAIATTFGVGDCENRFQAQALDKVEAALAEVKEVK